MKNITRFEKIALPLIFIHLIVGIAIAFYDRQKFDLGYVLEDGYIEWLTVLALVLGAAVCIKRAVTLWKEKNKRFLFFTIVLAGLYIFGAGEEISWGQRVFNLTPPKFFKEHNIQSEMNIHNLVVKGKKINKIVFGTGLGIAVVLYLLFLPVLYRKNEKIRILVDKNAIPIPRNHHILAYVLLFALVSATPSSKKGELMEFGGCWIFFLLTLTPHNYLNFSKKSS